MGRMVTAPECEVGFGAWRRRWRARGGRSHCSARVGVAWESAAGQSGAGGVARGKCRAPSCWRSNIPNPLLLLDAFEMKGLRRMLRVSWTAKKTNEWVLNKAGVKREVLDTVKARKLAYYGHTMRKQGSCLEREIMQGTMPGARRRGRPRTAWMDNIKTWTGLSVEESIRMTEDRDKWRKCVHGVANPRIEDG